MTATDIPAAEEIGPRRNIVQRRLAGEYVVDEWGLDPDLVDALSPFAALRWAVDVHGDRHVPAAGPALVVFNRRAGISEPFVLSRAVRLTTGRYVRVLGVPDVAPLGPVLRRLGGALSHPEELASLLRAGHVVALALDRELRRRERAGALHPEALAPAVELGVPVLPAAVIGREVGRAWRVEIGEPLDAPAGRGPLAWAEQADAARREVQALLDERFPPNRFALFR